MKLQQIEKEIKEIERIYQIILDHLPAEFDPLVIEEFKKWRVERLQAIADKYRLVKDLETIQRTDT